jgi:hypothetical protein
LTLFLIQCSKTDEGQSSIILTGLSRETEFEKFSLDHLKIIHSCLNNAMKKFQPVTPRELVVKKDQLQSPEKAKGGGKKIVAVKPDTQEVIPTVAEPVKQGPPLHPELEPVNIIKKNILEKGLNEITSFDILKSQREKCTKYWARDNYEEILEPIHKKKIVKKKNKKGNKVSSSPVGVSEKKEVPEKKQLRSLKQALITQSASQKRGNGRLLAVSTIIGPEAKAPAPATAATKPKIKEEKRKIGKASLIFKDWVKYNAKDLKAIAKGFDLPKENGEYSDIWSSTAWDTDST